MTHMFTDATSSLPIYSVRALSDATSSLPDYSVRAFSDETSSLPDYSVRAPFWQIEIWSGIYTVYFNCKYFTSPYFIYARAIRCLLGILQNPCGDNNPPINFYNAFLSCWRTEKIIDNHGVITGEVNKCDLIGLHDFISTLGGKKIMTQAKKKKTFLVF